MTAPSVTSATPDVPSQQVSPEHSARPSTRDDLRSYAELGGFTLTAGTHAWYAAVDTIKTSEGSRAASTALAELRVRDLPAVRRGAARVAAASALTEPDTLETTRVAVSLLARMRDTLTTLTPAVYAESDLDTLVAATATSGWRKEKEAKLPWGRRRSLLGRARGLAVAKRPRKDALHSALTAAKAERAEWAALVPDGGGPALPDDCAFLDDAAQSLEAATTGLNELGRLLRSERDLETVPFEELAELLDRLSADEGTLYRLPTLRSLRDRLESRGLADLLAELATRRADSAEATAAYDVREQEAAYDAREQEREVGEPETGAEISADPVTEAVPEAEAEAVPGPAAEAVAETAPDAEAAEASDVIVEAEADDTAPDVSDADTEADAHAPDLTAAVDTETDADRQTTTVDSADADTPAEDAAEEPLKTAAVTEAEARNSTDAEPTPPVQNLAGVTPVADVEPKADTEPVNDAKPVNDVEPVADTEPVNEVRDEPEAQPDADAEPVNGVAADPAAEAVQESPEATVPSPRRPRKPSLTPGRPVAAYASEDVVALMRWIDGDSVERTDEELLRAAMKELGFARLGPRIKDVLGAAVAEVRG